jgi:hypothetical protein
VSQPLRFSRDPLTMTGAEISAEIRAQETDEDRAELAQAEAEIKAGRWYSLRDGKFVPNPDWPTKKPDPTVDETLAEVHRHIGNIERNARLVPWIAALFLAAFVIGVVLPWMFPR